MNEMVFSSLFLILITAIFCAILVYMFIGHIKTQIFKESIWKNEKRALEYRIDSLEHRITSVESKMLQCSLFDKWNK
jgi:cell shape-determining protein MreC